MTTPVFIIALFLISVPTMTQTLDRTKRPAPAGIPRVSLPAIQKATLTNGLRIWLVRHSELPLAAFNLVIQSGADHDPVTMPGLATMTAELLDEGTDSRDALQVADDLEVIGATLSVRAITDGSFITLNTLTRHLDKALEVYCDVISNPTFPQKEFERIRHQRLTTLLQQKDRAATIANLAFNHILYGYEHPYGNDNAGTPASIESMRRDDLIDFYTRYYRPNNATMIIVGDVRLSEIVSRLEQGLAQWKSAPVPKLTMPPTPASERRMVYMIDKPAAPQSELRIGYPALARSTPDFFPVFVMNRILGGQFTSRVNLNLREKRGFTYGARTAFQFNKQPGPFVASAGVTTSKTDSSIQEFLYEIDRMRADGATAEELEYVKKGLSGNFALTFETPSQVAGALQNIVLYGLPEDYYENYLENIARVSLPDVARVSARYLDSSRMAVVVVGDVDVIREGIERLDIGEVVMCDVEGRRLQP